LEKIRRRLFLGLFPITFFSSPLFAGETFKKKRVMVLPVLHKQHQNNSLYSYEDIYRIVDAFNPDQVGVEIRQEDMASSDAYLIHNYPTEMTHLARFYGPRAFGFDWLGDELVNRPVPDDWWTKQSRVKQLERSLNDAPPNNSVRAKMLAVKIKKLSDEQERIIKASTASQLADGRYDSVTLAYYKDVEAYLRGTTYAEVSTFYSKRDAHLVANVVQHLRVVPEGRIAIVTGADHHGPIVRALAAMRTVELIRVPPAPNTSA
jgi:hypothetical protein